MTRVVMQNCERDEATTKQCNVVIILEILKSNQLNEKVVDRLLGILNGS